MNETDGAQRAEESQAEAFEREAQKPQAGIVVEFLVFLRENKKWWLAPIVLVLLLLGLLVFLASTAGPAFIYPF